MLSEIQVELGAGRNHPPPENPRWFQDELTKLSGLNPFGDPMLKITWGQSAQKWYRGRFRTKYVDPRHSAPLETQTFTRVKGKKRKVFKDLDAAMNSDWGLFRLESTYEWIGRPLWVVEQWFPADYMGDTLEHHEAVRWKSAEDKGLGYNVRQDMLGPYPVRGVYEKFIWVGEWAGERMQDGSVILEYRPLGRDILEDVRRRLQEREKAEKVDAFKAMAIINNELDAKGDQEAAEDAEDIKERLDRAITRYHMVAKDRVYAPALPQG